MLRENWEVWFAYDLEGSYEEAPQSLIDNAQRERRWCQGNLQHTPRPVRQGLARRQPGAFDPGHFRLSGRPALAGLSPHLQLDTLVSDNTDLSDHPVPAFTPYLHNLSGTAHALLIFVICMVVIMLPKFLALIDLAYDWQRRRAFGGLARTTAGVIGETVFSTLHAPLLMLWHTRFILTNLLGLSVGWNPQKRAADGTAWLYAVQRHWGHMLIGVRLGLVHVAAGPHLVLVVHPRAGRAWCCPCR